IVLGFVARRLAGSPVAFLAALRTDQDMFFERGGVPRLDLQPLDDAAATRLLQDRFPALAPKVRDRLLQEAQANPLALVELAVSLSRSQLGAVVDLPAVLPLGRRLESVFASRVNQLPAETRHVLLVAVLDGTGDVRLVQGANSRQYLAALTPAEHA